MRLYNTIGAVLKLGVALVMTTLVISSCDLDRYPSKSIILDQSLVTFEDAEGYNRGIMTQFRNRTTGVFVTPQEIMADCINASTDWGNSAPGLHGWEVLSPSDGSFATVYQMYYSTLKNVNFTLRDYPKVKESLAKEAEKTSSPKMKKVLEAQMAQIDIFIGVSSFARAYYYFNLLQRFALPYDPSTESTALGLPLVLEFDVSKSVKRNTVKECYDQIFKDLDAAEKALKGRKCAPGVDEFNVDCVTALRARIALERKEYDKAYNYAQSLIKLGRYPLVSPTKEAFENMWVYDKSTEDILNLYIDKEEGTYGMGSYYGYNAKERWHAPTYYPTQGLIDLYGADDLRKDVYFYVAPKAYINGVVYEGKVTIIKKYKGNPNYYVNDDEWGNKIPNGQHHPRIFRIAEQYLIAAEAAYFCGQDALVPLNELRASRGLAPVNSSGDALLKDIQEERLRELMAEGFRLFDLRRWGLPIKRMTPQKIEGTADFKDYLAHPYYNLNIGVNDKLYQKIVWAIPQREINTYGKENMPQNPGW